jgi:hypothetical protein
LAAAFFGAAFFAAGFLAAGFFATGFLAAGFFAAGFLAAAFFAAGFLAAGFFGAAAFLAAGLAAAFFAAGFLALASSAMLNLLNELMTGKYHHYNCNPSGLARIIQRPDTIESDEFLTFNRLSLRFETQDDKRKRILMSLNTPGHQDKRRRRAVASAGRRQGRCRQQPGSSQAATRTAVTKTMGGKAEWVVTNLQLTGGPTWLGRFAFARVLLHADLLS